LNFELCTLSFVLCAWWPFFNEQKSKYKDQSTKLKALAFGYLQSISPRIANVESIPTGRWYVVRKNLDTRIAKPFFCLSQVTYCVTHMSLADAALTYSVFNGKVQL